MAVKNFTKKITSKSLSATFLLSEGILIVLILKDVLVADRVYWLFFAIMVAYVVAIVLVKRRVRRP